MKKIYLIISIAFLLRVIWLDRFPSGFDMDEVQVGYNAYSILKTLRDENGNFLPLHTSFYDESRPMLSMYLTVPWIALFGLNVFAVRFANALLGAGAVFLTYLLAKKLFADEKLALVSSGLCAISPWHVILSRSSADGGLGLVTLLFSAVLFITWIKTGKIGWLIATYFAWVLTYFSYIGARPFIYIHAFFWIAFLVIKRQKTQAAVLAGIIALFSAFPVWVTIRSGEALSRYRQIGNITPQSAAVRLQIPFLEDASAKQPLVFTRLFHNKVENSLREIFSQYFQYINLNFLFATGGYPIRYRISEQPLQYWFEIPFFLLGIFALVRRLRLSSAYALFWFLVGAVPAALTTEDAPNLQRSVFMLPGFQIITAAGLLFAYKKLNMFKKRWVPVILTLIFMGGSWEIGRFIHQFTVHQPLHQPWHRNVQFQEIVSYVNQVQKDYEKILISKSGTEPYLYFLFFSKTDPELAQKLIIGKRNVEDDWDFGPKIRFVRAACPLEESLKPPEPNVLYGEVGECQGLISAKVVNVVKRPDGTVAMQFLTKE